jgi:glycerol-3-phosphate acyltransferase PlsY
MDNLRIVAAYGLTAALAYILGAVPFGFLIARLKGVDIRTQGSGNIGATNVFRVVGKPWGILTFALDFLKGLAGAWLAPKAGLALAAAADVEFLAIVGAALAIAGHNWPVYLGFRGGKGIATSGGAVLGIAWQPVAAGFVAWVLAFLLTRYVSLASIVAATTLVCCAWAVPSIGWPTCAVFTLLATLAIYRHKANIARLAKGTEHRFEFGRRKKGGAA